MSRAYTIRVSESVTHRVHVEDGIESKLALIAILGADRTAAILAEELEGRGWEVDEEGIARKTLDEAGVQIGINTKTGEVKIISLHDETMDLEVDKQGTIDEDFEQEGRERVRQSALKDLERLAKEADAKALEAVTKRLEESLTSVQPELDEITNAVTRKALLERAGQLGQITNVTENADGDMTIRVKV